MGLVVGKPIGVFLASFLAVKTGLAQLPDGVTWRGILGVGLLAGIGFTMSLFIAGLSFDLIFTIKPGSVSSWRRWCRQV